MQRRGGDELINDRAIASQSIGQSWLAGGIRLDAEAAASTLLRPYSLSLYLAVALCASSEFSGSGLCLCSSDV